MTINQLFPVFIRQKLEIVYWRHPNIILYYIILLLIYNNIIFFPPDFPPILQMESQILSRFLSDIIFWATKSYYFKEILWNYAKPASYWYWLFNCSLTLFTSKMRNIFLNLRFNAVIQFNQKTSKLRKMKTKAITFEQIVGKHR